MLEAYSVNVAATANTAVALNNITIEKGCTAKLVSPTTIQLNKSGVYMVACDASFTPAAEGIVGIELQKNNVIQPQAQSTATGAVDTTTNLNFTTLVQVTHDNTSCCTSSPTTLQIISLADGTFDSINVCITKIC